MDFRDGSPVVAKRLVVIWHQGRAAILLKTTSNTSKFEGSENGFKGVVFFEAGECSAFEKDTVISPDESYLITHSELEGFCRKGKLEFLGHFKSLSAKLESAVQENEGLVPSKKAKLLEWLSLNSSSTQI